MKKFTAGGITLEMVTDGYPIHCTLEVYGNRVRFDNDMLRDLEHVVARAIREGCIMSSDMKLTIDFETASAADISVVGAWAYAEHPTTEILCAAWVVDSQEKLWIPGHNDSYLHFLTAEALNPYTIFEAHHAAFEMAIWHYIMVGQLGMPPIPIERWDCTMARCLYRGLPGEMAKAARIMALAEQKDMEGSKLTISLSKPMTQVAWMERWIV